MFKLLCVLFLSAALFATGLRVGTTISPLELQDQFEKKVVANKETRFLLIATTKEHGKQIDKFLVSKGGDSYLLDKKMIYISDLTAAPSFVVNTFMLPKFKKYTYPIGLLREDSQREILPILDSKISFVTLENMVIQKIEYFDTATFLENIK